MIPLEAVTGPEIGLISLAVWLVIIVGDAVIQRVRKGRWS